MQLTPPATADIELAAELVLDAGRLAARMRADGLGNTRERSGGKWVTKADYAVEAMVSERLAKLRPQDGVVGEEGAQRNGRRRWYLDPIDGTHNFMNGLSSWCSAIALTDDEGPAVGAIYHPSADELWVAGRHCSTTCNGDEVDPLQDAPLRDISVATSLPARDLRGGGVGDLPALLRVLSGAGLVRILGSASIELASVAGGRLGASVQRDSQPWDWYPGAAMVVAAGGVAHTFEHGSHRWHLAGNQQSVLEIKTALLGA